jgi:hypothetical protein
VCEEQYSRKLRSTFKTAKEENITVLYLSTTISNMIRIGKLGSLEALMHKYV